MKTFFAFLAIAVSLAAATCAKGDIVTGLLANGLLVRFDSANPNGILGAPIVVSGLTAGDSLFGIDYRPIDGVLVGLGYNPMSGSGRVYSINTTTGAATQIQALNLPLGAGFSQFGFDFNPFANALRIVDSNAGNNTRITSGGAGSVFIDGNINPAGASIVALAYSNNFTGAASTTLFGVDSVSSNLVMVGSPGGSPTSPNTGTLFTVGGLGIAGSTVTGFDIQGASTAYLSTNPTPGVSKFFTVNLTTGAATEVIGFNGTGNIGGGLNVRDISVRDFIAGCGHPLGDINGDGVVNLLDVSPFVTVLTSGMFQCEADANEDGVVNLLDVAAFVMILTGP